MIIMRTDLLQSNKDVHVKLEKDVHAALRAKLFKHNVSMQEVFNEFAKLVAMEDSRASRIIEQFVMRKIKDEISGKSKKTYYNVNELDHDALYNLIEEDLWSHEIA